MLRAPMARKSQPPSQLIELLLGIADDVGLSADKDLAQAAGVSPETVVNWRTGSVQELKPQKLDAVRRALSARIGVLQEQAGRRHRRPGPRAGAHRSRGGLESGRTPPPAS